MKSFAAFLKKEFLDIARTGRLFIAVLVFVLSGMMSPAIAKLTPWMMEMFAETMEDSGFIFTNIQVDAMTSWTQFFKNLPIVLIAFVLMFSDIFTKEYKSGTLLLVLSKGLSRYKVVLAKAAVLLLMWTFGYGLCFGITYGYNAYFWDNSIVCSLFSAVTVWWLFGVWVIGLMVLFSSLVQGNTGVSLCTGGTVLLAYLLCIMPKSKVYSPAMLMDTASLLNEAVGIGAYRKAVIVAVVFLAGCIAASIPVMNKKQL